MNTSSRSKSIALISGLVFIAGLGAFYMNAFGLLPIFVIIISFFMLVVHGVLYLSGHREEGVFEAYQYSRKTMAGAMHLGMNDKASDDNNDPR
ncbi:hypothetical protein [Photobacterium nomapromontoriensis]|uniref:hypothetical protein n=1 Tax=Photobacterium nomapromontoriensis TaxID=2910237 RepID=UPI003D0CE0E2